MKVKERETPKSNKYIQQNTSKNSQKSFEKGKP